MISLGLLAKFEIDNRHKCEVCVESKFVRKTHPSVERNNELLSLIHSDICDFRNNPSRGGKKYFITFIDDFSKYCKVFLLNSKDEALEVFKIYKAEVENQLGKKLKVLRSDRGGEF